MRNKILLLIGLSELIKKRKNKSIDIFSNLTKTMKIPIEYTLFRKLNFNPYITYSSLSINVEKWAKILNNIKRKDINFLIFYKIAPQSIIELLPLVSTPIKFKILNNSPYNITEKKDFDDDLFTNTLLELMDYNGNTTNVNIFPLFILCNMKKTMNYKKGIHLLKEIRKRKGSLYTLRGKIISLIVTKDNKDKVKEIMKGEKSAYCWRRVKEAIRKA